MTTTTFIGGGMMGEAILSGMIAAGTDPHDIIVVEKVAERAQHLAQAHGIRLGDIATGVAQADVVMVAVKPQGFDDALREMQPHLQPSSLVISIAAGKTLATMEQLLPGTHCIRVMPNTPALVGEGMSAISPGTHASDADLQRAIDMLATVGRTVVVPESQQDAITAMHGSGPAFYYYVMESFIEGGISMGLDRELAHQLALQTLIGSAALIQRTGTSPEELRRNVTSPGGTTAAAIATFEQRGLRDILIAGQHACRDRGAELATS